jgi:hypothetical protein
MTMINKEKMVPGMLHMDTSLGRCELIVAVNNAYDDDDRMCEKLYTILVGNGNITTSWLTLKEAVRGRFITELFP